MIAAANRELLLNKLQTGLQIFSANTPASPTYRRESSKGIHKAPDPVVPLFQVVDLLKGISSDIRISYL